MGEYRTIKVWERTYEKLRMLVAVKKRSQLLTLNEIITDALEAEGVYFVPVARAQKGGAE